MDDVQLVEAARAGDRNAAAAIYDRYADPVHDFCASILRDEADANDALQATFLAAFELLDQLAEPARLRAWLFALAHRAILDQIPPDGAPFGEDDPDGQAWGLDPTGQQSSAGNRPTNPPATRPANPPATRQQSPAGSRPANPPGSRPQSPAEERLSRAELAEFVWQMSAGWAVADRVLLDLHVRQGLEGRDLANAAGIAVSQVDAQVQQLTAQFERSIGALLVARTGRRSCAAMFGILSRWDGRLTREFRDAVTAHVDDCEVCNSRRRIAPSPLSLMSATPLLAAPAYLRNLLLAKADAGGGIAPSAWVINRDGFPELGTGSRRPEVTGFGARAANASTRATTVLPGSAFARPGGGPGRAGGGVGEPTWALSEAGADGVGGGGSRDPTRAFSPVGPSAPTTYLPREPAPPGHDDHDRLGVLIGTVAGLIVLIAGTLFFVSSRSHSKKVGVGVTTTTVTATTNVATTLSTIPVIVTVPVSTGPTTTVADVGHLSLASPKAFNLGATSTTASIVVRNDGTALLDFSVTAAGVGLMVNPVAGTLVPGANQTLSVTLDRTASPPGPYSGQVAIASATDNQTVTIAALIDPGPAINSEMATPMAVVNVTGCAGQKKTTTTVGAGTTSTVTAAVTSTEAVQEVFLHWQNSGGGTGGSGITPMMASGIGGFGYKATLGPFGSAGTVDWWITAIDGAGANNTSTHHNLIVNQC